MNGYKKEIGHVGGEAGGGDMTQNDTGGECGINGISGPSDTDTIDQDVRPAAVYRTAVPVIVQKYLYTFF